MDVSLECASAKASTNLSVGDAASAAVDSSGGRFLLAHATTFDLKSALG